ncbi:hypothetical protein ALC57_05563 [Trachymyrmex cornetzi]|uniref:Uncharacterized protein n=1 Tax=Trachymyrmex cornetzi TaxID=471704 RepID=A0A151JAJ7_9HYME|nr:hypothetical protein ALC57_05563 [Trachymyrmex cornetzi]
MRNQVREQSGRCANGSLFNRIVRNPVCVQTGLCAIGSVCNWIVRNRVRTQSGRCAIESVRNRIRAQSDRGANGSVSDRNTMCPITNVSDRVRVRLLMCAIETFPLISLKRRALNKFRQIRLKIDWLCFCELHNSTTTAIRREKKSFLSSSLAFASPRDFWRNFFSLGAMSSSSPSIYTHLLDPFLLNNYFIDSLPSFSSTFSISPLLSDSSIVSTSFTFNPYICGTPQHC